MGLLYMMASLDRSNLGNAKIAGLPDDIGLVGNQFGTATTLLYDPRCIGSRVGTDRSLDMRHMSHLKARLQSFSKLLAQSH